MTRLKERVSALEAQMAKMRQEWQIVERTPAAQNRLLNSLRQTQLEHGRDIDQLKGDVAELKGDVAELKGDVVELKGGLARLERKLDLGLDNVVALIATVIQRLPERPADPETEVPGRI